MGRIIGNIEDTIMKKKNRKKEVRCPYCGSKDIEVISDIIGNETKEVKFRCKRCKRTF